MTIRKPVRKKKDIFDEANQILMDSVEKKHRENYRNTGRLSLRVPRELLEAQQKLAKQLNMTHTQLFICLSLLIPYHDDREVSVKLKDMKFRSECVLDRKNLREGILFDVAVGKWAVAIKYRETDKKCVLVGERFTKFEDARHYVLERNKRHRREKEDAKKLAKYEADKKEQRRIDALKTEGKLDMQKVYKLDELIAVAEKSEKVNVALLEDEFKYLEDDALENDPGYVSNEKFIESDEEEDPDLEYFETQTDLGDGIEIDENPDVISVSDLRQMELNSKR